MDTPETETNMSENPNTPHHGRQIVISLIILAFLILGTIAVVLYGTGYRFGFQEGKPTVSKTGILVANSNPKGAQVFLDGHLTTATDTTLNLTPGDYTVKIVKEGYSPWEKRLKIKEKVVTEADALLFPIALKLEGVSATGVEGPVLDPQQTRIAFLVSSQSFRKNGVYVYDMTTNPVLTLQGTAKQVVDDTFDTFSKATLTWSPDSQQILATIAATPSRNESIYLLDATQFNQTPQDVTAILDTTRDAWKKLSDQKETARLNSLKKTVRDMISKNFAVLSWSPDDTKILYVAKDDSTLPLMITPRLVGITNSISEDRTIKKDHVYVYSVKEDVNVKLFDAVPEDCADEEVNCHAGLNWFPDSEHLIFVDDEKIVIMEYDGSNKITVYAGPFLDHYVFPWPDGSKLVVLTNLNNPSNQSNLYTVSLK
ncbi:MAG: PEGA domain-containing protein [bacterium]|nr:PEGA domain-containing protein [bacterium]